MMRAAIQRAIRCACRRTPEEARKQVDELAAQHVDAIKGILEAGVPGYPFNRMESGYAPRGRG